MPRKGGRPAKKQKIFHELSDLSNREPSPGDKKEEGDEDWKSAKEDVSDNGEDASNFLFENEPEPEESSNDEEEEFEEDELDDLAHEAKELMEEQADNANDPNAVVEVEEEVGDDEYEVVEEDGNITKVKFQGGDSKQHMEQVARNVMKDDRWDKNADRARERLSKIYGNYALDQDDPSDSVDMSVKSNHKVKGLKYQMVPCLYGNYISETGKRMRYTDEASGETRVCPCAHCKNHGVLEARRREPKENWTVKHGKGRRLGD